MSPTDWMDVVAALEDHAREARKDHQEAEAASRRALLAAARALDEGDELTVDVERLRVVLEDRAAEEAAVRARGADLAVERARARLERMQWRATA